MPTSVRVAIIAMAVLAALLLSNAALTGFLFDTLVEEFAEQSELTEDQGRRLVIQNLVLYSVLGVLLALAAAFLPRRQPWSRWVGLAASAALGLLSLFLTLAAGAVSIYSLLLLVLTVSSVTSLMSRTTRAWVPPLRAGA
jgi:predicted lipid-binding transport protein (Tim44 family)